jgi:hypothetical protein
VIERLMDLLVVLSIVLACVWILAMAGIGLYVLRSLLSAPC